MSGEVKASAFRSVDLGSILLSSRTKHLKMVFTASLLDAWHERNSMGKKPASARVVAKGKALQNSSTFM